MDQKVIGREEGRDSRDNILRLCISVLYWGMTNGRQAGIRLPQSVGGVVYNTYD
jgi:hypothetical protein